MRRPNYALLVLVAVVMGLAGLQAQAPAELTVFAVAYVDVMPSGKAAAVAALKTYREASAKDAGHIRIDVFEQIGRPAHFAIVEAWRDQSAFDAHAGSAATKQFQQAFDKLRVSGYDQRPYKSFSVASARTGGSVHVVSHVDIAGAEAQAKAPAVLRQIADASRAEQGNLRYDILQHVTRANHFTVVESWTNQAALEAHGAAAHTRQYRDTVQPMTGSPLDERVYLAVE